MSKCSCPEMPKTRYYFLFALSIGMIVWAMWSMDWAQTHTVTNTPVTFFAWTFNPSEWMNIAWMVMILGIAFGFLSVFKLAYMRCRGE